MPWLNKGREIDYAFFVCDGIYNMDMEEAIACAKLVNAKHSIPYHMVPGKLFDQKRAEEFDVPGRLLPRINSVLPFGPSGAIRKAFLF